MLRKTRMFSGDPAPFVMELPAYHWPTVGNLLRSMWERASSFIKKAGTIILLASIVIWAGSVFGVLDFEGMSQLAAYSFLVFNLLCAPCFAAIGAIRREMNSAKWTLFAVGYQCVFAYAVSLMIFQFGSAFTGALQPVGLVCAVAVLALLLFMLFRPYKQAKQTV